MKVFRENHLSGLVGEGWFAFGDVHHFVIGQIKSIGYDEDEGVRLYVTPPRYRGKDIKRLEPDGEKWVAISPNSEASLGDLVILGRF